MQSIPRTATAVAQGALVSASTFVAVALLALVLAYWTWAWFAPNQEPRTPPAESGGSASVGPGAAALGAFGHVVANGPGMSPLQAGAPIRLLGVVAATGIRAAYAVVKVDAKGALAIRAGDEISAGIRLVEVHADRVVLERNGAREALPLPERASPAAAVPAK